jgi:hypothetical protein
VNPHTANLKDEMPLLTSLCRTLNPAVGSPIAAKNGHEFVGCDFPVRHWGIGETSGLRLARFQEILLRSAPAAARE